MSRLREVPLREANEEVRALYREFFGERDPVSEPGTATGTPGNFWTTFALAPDLMQMAYRDLFMLLAPGRRLPAQYRELAIVRTGLVGDSKFEFSQHLKMARLEGVPEEKLQAIKGWTTSKLFTDAERAVLAATDEILARNLVEDATFAALKVHFDDPTILELFVVIGSWRMYGLIVRALHLEYDNDLTARMQEVPAPV